MMTLIKRLLAGGAVVAALAGPVLTPAPAQAWWAHPGWGHPGWGWHTGWGWRGGVYIGGPRVVVGPPVVYGRPGYRWLPGYYTPYGVWIAPHWGY